LLDAPLRNRRVTRGRFPGGKTEIGPSNIDGKRFRIVDDDEYGRGFYQGWDNVIFCKTGFLHQQCELAVAVRNG
jgi:hypothetical protein